MTHHVKPGESIQAAIDRASDGDTVQLGAGTFTGGRFDFRQKKNLSLRGTKKNATIILDTRGIGISNSLSGGTIADFDVIWPNWFQRLVFKIKQKFSPPAAATGQTSRPSADTTVEPVAR